MKPKASECARLAQAVYQQTPTPIPYREGRESIDPKIGADCQGWIEAIIRELGGKISYAGTNEMWRRAAAWWGTIAEARKTGHLVPGACALIIKQDGGEPSKYKQGGSAYKAGHEGNCSHIGWYIGSKDYEVIDASYSRQTVSPTKQQNGFTHIMWIKEVDYSEYEGVSGGTEAVESPGSFTAIDPWKEAYMSANSYYVVHLPFGREDQTVNLRKAPNMKGNTIVYARLPNNTIVKAGDEFESDGETWRAVAYKSLRGYMISGYLEFKEEADGEDIPFLSEPYVDAPIQSSFEERLKALEDKVALIEEITGIGGR